MVLSVEHPIFTALIDSKYRRFRNPKNPDQIDCYGIDNYQTEGEREASWGEEDLKPKIYHKTFATYINTFCESGFEVERIDEPFGNEEEEKKCATLSTAKRRPNFICFKLRKKEKN